MDDIKTMLRCLPKDKTSTLIISCGVNARHGKLIKLLDACYEAGITNLSVVNNEAIPFHRTVLK